MNQPTSITDKLFTTAIIGGVVVGGYFFISSQMKKAALQDTEGKLGQSKEGQQALAIRAALNPSGMSWLMSLDTTNTEALMKVAREIKDFKTVASSYRNLFQADLSTDLTNELKAQEAKAFFAIVNATKEKRYLPNEVIPTASGEVALYNNAVPIAKNMVRRAKTTSVIMGTVVTKVLIKNPKTGSQKTVLMNKIKFENKDYWVLSSELKPKV